MFEAIIHCVRHVPKNHMLLIAGDCNLSLTADAPHVNSPDPKFSQAIQNDKYEFQSMIRDLDLVAIHCKNNWTPTFRHGDHSSRIDFMFIRRHQIQWNKRRAQVLIRFERTIGRTAPIHLPLVISLPKWFAIPRVTPSINSIDRHRLRPEYWTQTENWHTFESQVMTTVHQIISVQMTSQPCANPQEHHLSQSLPAQGHQSSKKLVRFLAAQGNVQSPRNQQLVVFLKAESVDALMGFGIGKPFK